MLIEGEKSKREIICSSKYKTHTKILNQRKKTMSLTNCKTNHERVGKMRNLERLNLRSRELKVVSFGGDTTIIVSPPNKTTFNSLLKSIIDFRVPREFPGWTTL